MNRILKLAALGIIAATTATNQAGAALSDFSVYNYQSQSGSIVGRLYTPPTTAGQKYPLVIFLHGAGEGYGDNHSQVERNIDNLLLAAKGVNQPQKFFLLCPQSTTDSWSDIPDGVPWKIDRALSMGAGVVRDYPIDVSRIYVTGLSAGGLGTWMAAAYYHGNVIAGAVPLSPNAVLTNIYNASTNPSGVFPAGVSASLVNFPIWIYHARNDSGQTTYTNSEDDVNLIRAADGRSALTWPLTSTEEGYVFSSPGVSYYNDANQVNPPSTSTLYDFHNLRYSEYNTGGHGTGTWDRAYNEAAMYAWLFGKTSSLQNPLAGETFLFDFGPTATNPADDFSGRTWNSVTSQPDDAHIPLAPVVAYAKTTTGAIRSVSLTVSKSFHWVSADAVISSTAYPSNVSREAWGGGNFPDNATGHATPGELLVGGLTPGSTYKITCYGATPGASYWGTTDFTVTGTTSATQNLATKNNLNNKVTFNSVIADSKGNIHVAVVVGSAGDGSEFGAISALEVQVASGGTIPTISGTAPSPATVGTAYPAFSYSAMGTPTPTFSVTAGNLPPGISLNGATGALSGTPTGTGGIYTGTIAATNTAGSAPTNFSITVNAPPAFTNGAAPTSATVGVNYNNSANGFTFTASGFPAPTLSATGVPPGMSFANATGKLTGMPTAAGTYTVTVTALNNYGPGNHTTPQNVTITVAASTSAPTISGVAPAGTVGSAYTFGYTVAGSPAPTLSVGSGALPAGVTISGNNITGTPTTAGTYTGSIVATNGVGSPASVSFNIVISSPGSLPANWATADIGTTGAAGSASYSSGTYTLTGSGADIWGYNDSFRFLYQTATLDGDGSIVVKVVDAQNTGAWAKTGIMMRASMATNSQHAMMCLSPAGNGATSFMYRATAGDVSNATTVYNSPAPIWYKLTRAGSLFTGYSSPTGVDGTWTTIGSQTISMPTSIYVGMVECSTASGTLGTAHFSNVTVSSAMSMAAVGSTATGTASISGGTFSVTSTTGANGDCWGTSDNFYYLYAAMPGDGTVIAQVTGMTNTSPYSKSGIMIRKDLTASATHASVFYTPAQSGGSAQVNMYYRLSQGGLTDYSGVGGNYGSTMYLRLVRVGSTFTASVSPTGMAGSYTTLGSQNISGMTGTVYVGLMECSHTATAGTATFNPVTLP